MDRTRRISIGHTSTSELDESKIDDYKVVAMLARGGTASVYLAAHVPTGNRVALKLLDPMFATRPEVVERFMAEHEISRTVRHPGLLDITVAAKTLQGVPYIIMEVLDGESLGKLAERGNVEIDAILAIGTQIASACAAMHRNGYIHCDIKPDNVFVLYEATKEGFPQVKLIDYGVSRKASDGHTNDGTIAGTPAYMPPEQWRGKTCFKSDVYALGCLLYELTCGNQPFHGTLPQLMILHSEQLPMRPSTYRYELATTMEGLIMRMLSKEPELRPTMDEVEYTFARLAWHRRSQTHRDLRPVFEQIAIAAAG